MLINSLRTSGRTNPRRGFWKHCKNQKKTNFWSRRNICSSLRSRDPSTSTRTPSGETCPHLIFRILTNDPGDSYVCIRPFYLLPRWQNDNGLWKNYLRGEVNGQGFFSGQQWNCNVKRMSCLFALWTDWTSKVNPNCFLYQTRPNERDSNEQDIVTWARCPSSPSSFIYKWHLSNPFDDTFLLPCTITAYQDTHQQLKYHL